MNLNLPFRLIYLIICIALFELSGIHGSLSAQQKPEAPKFAITFQDGPPPSLNPHNSKVEVSQEKLIFGLKTLKWMWESQQKISFNAPFQLERYTTHNGIIYVPVFNFYIYNTQPNSKPLRINIGKDQNTICSFEFNLNFSGWRTASVRYTDMEGKALDEMNHIEFVSPKNGSGTFFLGPIRPNRRNYQAMPMADLQVPFVADGEEEHRGPHANRSHLKVLRLKAPTYNASSSETEAIHKLESQLFQHFSQELNPNHLDLTQSLDKFQNFLAKHDIDFDQSFYAAFGLEVGSIPGINLKKRYFRMSRFMAAIAPLAVHYANDFKNITTNDQIHVQKCRKIFEKLIPKLIDTGWVSGHARGSIHNIGYKIKHMAPVLYIIKDRLKHQEHKKAMTDLMTWLTNAKECQLQPSGEHESSLDYFHTFAIPQLLALMMTDDIHQRVYWVKTLSQNLSHRVSLQRNDDEDGFKHDGTAFHHGGHYPDYAWGALRYLSQLMRWLHDTPFQLSKSAHENFKHAVMSATIYTNTYDLPLALLGRHPFSHRYNTDQNPGLKKALLNLSFMPESKQSIDRECAAAYLRLFGTLEHSDEATLSELAQHSIKAETPPQGHWNFNNAATSIHRREDWMVMLKGYSRYVWLGETWSNANRYGLFQSHGGMDILLPGGLKDSGFIHPGWDWRRQPGTTSLHVPLDVLTTAISPHKNKKSAEIFVGGVTFGDHGAFAMTLNDRFFDLSAKKSYFCFDDKIIALGSNINSRNAHYPAQTTLFQNAILNPKQTGWVHHKKQTLKMGDHLTLIASEQHPVYIGDAVGNTYLVKHGTLNIKVSKQHSRMHQNGKPTDHPYLSAWLDHGSRANHQAYHYTTHIQNESFQKATSNHSVLQQDQQAHIVHDHETNIVAANLFEAGELQQHPFLKSHSHPVLVMGQQKEQHLKLSICEPDLKWGQKTPQTEVLLLLKGAWTPTATSPAKRLGSDQNGDTYLLINCDMGKTSFVELRR